jgi:hypothetical protein
LRIVEGDSVGANGSNEAKAPAFHEFRKVQRDLRQNGGEAARASDI